jgi:hypothetical protein
MSAAPSAARPCCPETGFRQQPTKHPLAFAVNEKVDVRGAHQGVVRGDLGPSKDNPGRPAAFSFSAKYRLRSMFQLKTLNPISIGARFADQRQQSGIAEIGDQAFGQDLNVHAAQPLGRLLEAGRTQGDVAGLAPEILARDRQL